MLSIVVTPAEHQVFTNAWRKQIGYISDKVQINTKNAKKTDIEYAIKEVYKDYPDIIETLNQIGF